MKKLSTAERVEFTRLVNATGSKDGCIRVLARLKLNRFVIQHGEVECKAYFEETMAKRKKKK